VVVAAWALGLAALSLVLRGPDADDTYYVHLSSWIDAHGAFPLRDVLYGDQRLPALYFPPVASYEALAGSVAHLTPLRAPDVVYFLVPPLASALAVLALWRLLRAWRVTPAAVALSVALAFLVLDAAGPRMFGAFFAGRIWQGKVLFVAVGMPLLLAVVQEYADRPGRRSLALVAAAGIAAAGLTTTAIFVVPVLAAGVLVAAGPRAGAALAAYPLAAGVATLAVHGRTPDVYRDADVVPGALAHYVLGSGGLAFLGLVAALAGPLVLPRRAAALVSGIALAVALALAPGVPAAILHATGLGRVLWRLLWAIPVAALLGALAVGAPRRALVLVVAAILLVAAQPVWTLPGGPRRTASITWKRPPADLSTAHRILAGVQPGDVVLAPAMLSQTLAAVSGTVYLVNPRTFYTQALGDHTGARLLLSRFAAYGLRAGALTAVTRALRAVRVDDVCLPANYGGALAVLRAAGYRHGTRAEWLECLRAA
jgi:hypothetical protein